MINAMLRILHLLPFCKTKHNGKVPVSVFRVIEFRTPQLNNVSGSHCIFWNIHPERAVWLYFRKYISVLGLLTAVFSMLLSELQSPPLFPSIYTHPQGWGLLSVFHPNWRFHLYTHMLDGSLSFFLQLLTKLLLFFSIKKKLYLTSIYNGNVLQIIKI